VEGEVPFKIQQLPPGLNFNPVVTGH
jgi:hypothetical protein